MKKVVAGVDIGGTNTVYGLVDENGKVLSQGSFKTTDYPKVETSLQLLTAAIKKLLTADKEFRLAANRHRCPGCKLPQGND